MLENTVARKTVASRESAPTENYQKMVWEQTSSDEPEFVEWIEWVEVEPVEWVEVEPVEWVEVEYVEMEWVEWKEVKLPSNDAKPSEIFTPAYQLPKQCDVCTQPSCDRCKFLEDSLLDNHAKGGV